MGTSSNCYAHRYCTSELLNLDIPIFCLHQLLSTASVVSTTPPLPLLTCCIYDFSYFSYVYNIIEIFYHINDPTLIFVCDLRFLPYFSFLSNSPFTDRNRHIMEIFSKLNSTSYYTITTP